MTSCRHHSGYLADDEAGHTTYMARVQPPKKPLFPEMGHASKLGPMPHPPSTYGPTGSSGLHSHCRKPKSPQSFGSFLDFLVEGQVLDSLQTVVEEATERVATMKTEAGVPLVEVQDPLEVPRGRQHRRTRPNLRTVLRHRAQPSLCTGHPNNYPSCSSSMSDSPSSFMTGWLDSHSQDSYLGAHGLGPLPPIRNRLLMEKNLKRLLRLENKGKGLGLPSSQSDSLFWESLGSQASSQWTSEQPLSWFSGLMGSSMSTPETSEAGIGEEDLIFLKQEFNKEIQSLLSQPLPFNLPGYCSLQEPHRTFDFLAEHHLFPALQHIINQAVDKLSGARRHDGCPLFPSTEWEATRGPNSNPMPGSKPITLTDEKEPNESIPSTASNSKMVWRKSNKDRGRAKPKEGGSPVSSAQGSTRFTLQNPNYKLAKKKPLPTISSKSSESSISNPWQEELINYLTEQALSLLIYKYKYEKRLTKQLGFISFPITEVLMDLFLGFKKVKGSCIHLSSKIDWSCLLQKLEEAEWAQQASQGSQQASQQASLQMSSQASQKASPKVSLKASQQGFQQTSWQTSQPSKEFPSTVPQLVTNREQDGTTSSLHSDLLHDPLTSQENTTTEEQELMSPSELKLSTSPSTSMGSTQFKQAINKEDTQGSEVDDSFFGEKGEPHSLLEPHGETPVSLSSDMSHGDPP
ncbi:coiled-coil domain-containing protein 116 isoform X2 [Talpa occidentalis]|uniref:coiled-coil domain-containing protein 116 isoform X2 n=1 Tax=Talpa occidentalis TaxID=50954 RepID=UPI00188E7FC8|nr:coiled-coil domain-containing protein 116 isoform X2 [Talpa occidentalis]